MISKLWVYRKGIAHCATSSVRRAGSSILLLHAPEAADKPTVTLFVWPFTWRGETGRRCARVFEKITRPPAFSYCFRVREASSVQKFQSRCSGVNTSPSVWFSLYDYQTQTDPLCILLWWNLITSLISSSGAAFKLPPLMNVRWVAATDRNQADLVHKVFFLF